MPPEGGADWAAQMLHRFDEALANLDEAWRDVDKMLRGNGGPGIAEQVRKNRADIDRLLEGTPKDVERAEVDRVRWAAIKEWAGPFGILLALALSIYNTLGAP